MKCPQCNYNQRRKRQGIKCIQCGYVFVFDPLRNDPVLDYRMANMIKKASSNDTQYFTPDMLYGLFLRYRKHDHLFYTAVVLLIISAISGIMSFNVDTANAKSYTIISLFFFIPSILYYISYRYKKVHNYLSRKDFDKALQKWQKNSILSSYKLIETPGLRPPPDWKEKDIFSYGVEKIIILDNNLSVDLMIKNNEHVNAKALIISSTGYPKYLKPILKKILAEQTDIPIVLLHGSSRQAHTVVQQFKNKTGIDLNNYTLQIPGYTAEQLKEIKYLQNYPPEVRHKLSLDMLPYAATIGLFSLSAALLAEEFNKSSALAYIIEDDDFE